MTYMMETRKQVVEYLRKQKNPVLREHIQTLGSDHPKIRWDSMNAIIEDLKSEKQIVIVKKKAGKRSFMTIEYNQNIYK